MTIRDATDLVLAYRAAKEAVVGAGYQAEISWQDSIRFEDTTESDFIREYAWVVLSAGMKESVIRGLFGHISECFFNWESSRRIAASADTCCQLALRRFNHPRKIGAILETACLIAADGFEPLRRQIQSRPIETLDSLPYIGPVTSYHLAKNLGFSFAKPDRHLQRLARAAGYSSVQHMCRTISARTGDSPQVVDIVLWRFATVDRSYLDTFLRGCSVAFAAGKS